MDEEIEKGREKLEIGKGVAGRKKEDLLLKLEKVGVVFVLIRG